METFRESAKQNIRKARSPEGSIKPVLIDWNLDGDTVVTKGDKVVRSINLKRIKLESIEQHDIIYDLLILLNEQAWMALDAESLVDLERGTAGARARNQDRRDQHKHILDDCARLERALGGDVDTLRALLDEFNVPEEDRPGFNRRSIARTVGHRYRMTASRIGQIRRQQTKTR